MARKTDTFPKREERVPYSGKADGTTERPRGRKTQGRRKSSAPRKPNPNRKKTKISPKQAGIGILIVVLLIVGFALFHKNGAEVFVGENSMGILSDTSITPEQIVQNLEAQLAAEVGTNVKINEEITVERLHVSGERKKDVCTMEYMLPKLKSAVTYKVEASVIFVDGGAVAPLATKAQAEEVLQQVKDTYYPSQQTAESTNDAAATTDTAQTTDTTDANDTTTADNETSETNETTTEGTTTTSNAEISFVESVEIQTQFVNSAEILSVEDAFAKLTSTTPVTTTYAVQSKDTLAKIAAEFDMTLEEVIAANPGMTISTPIVVGQTINVTEQKPMVSVKSVETQVLTMVEKKTYETQYDDTKPASYQRVIQQGRDGQKKSTIQITRVNGLVTEEKEVSKEVIQEPVTEIIVKGTQ